MRCYRYLVCICLLVVGFGCGHLNANVAVLSSEYLDEHRKDSTMMLTFALGQTEETLSENNIEVQAKIEDYYKYLVKIYTEKCEENQDENSRYCEHAKNWKPNKRDKEYIKILNAKTEMLSKYNNLIRQRYNLYQPEKQRAILSGDEEMPAYLKRLLVVYSSLSDEYNYIVEDEISFDQKIKDEKTLAKIAKAKDEVCNSAQGISFSRFYPHGEGIGSDPLASIVAGAPNSAWNEEYNYALVQGDFGDLDIVVILNNDGNYSIKGVTFDPGNVAAMVSRAASQMAVMAAQIAGVPLVGMTGSGQTPGSGLANASGNLGTTISKMENEEAKLKSFQRTIKLMGNAIVAERSAIEGPDKNPDDEAAKINRMAAISALKAMFDNHKARLNISTDKSNENDKPANDDKTTNKKE